MSKYYAINSEDLARALRYLGFQFLRFNNDKYGEVYSFKNTKELHEAIRELNKLKKF